MLSRGSIIALLLVLSAVYSATVVIDAGGETSKHFTPSKATINIGDTVEFINLQNHNVVQVAGPESQLLVDGGITSGETSSVSKFSYTFANATQPEYHFACASHLACCDMRTTINVKNEIKQVAVVRVPRNEWFSYPNDLVYVGAMLFGYIFLSISTL
jgi:plastocyanin